MTFQPLGKRFVKICVLQIKNIAMGKFSIKKGLCENVIQFYFLHAKLNMWAHKCQCVRVMRF